MPQMVSSPVPASQLKVDDAIDIETGATTISEIAVKTKYVYITDAIGTTHVVDKDEMIVRHRYEKTDEEKAADNRSYMNDVIKQMVENASSTLVHAREKMVEALDYNVDMHWSYYPVFITAQTEHGLWMQVYGVESHDDVADFVDALKIVVEEETRRMLEWTKFLSRRSTSVMANAVMANAIEDVVHDTKARWLCAQRWNLTGIS